MLFAHLKRLLKLDRLRLRGPNGAHDEFLLAATAQNLRKMAKLIPKERARNPRNPGYPPRSPAVAEEDVVGGIGDAEKGTGSIARALRAPAASVDALHSGGVCEGTASAPVHNLQL
jgi:hypothetical protein